MSYNNGTKLTLYKDKQIPKIGCQNGGGGLVTKWCLTLVTPWTVACQAPLSVEFSRQEYCKDLPFPSPFMCLFASYFTCVYVKHLLKSLPPFQKLCI